MSLLSVLIAVTFGLLVRKTESLSITNLSDPILDARAGVYNYPLIFYNELLSHHTTIILPLFKTAISGSSLFNILIIFHIIL